MKPRIAVVQFKVKVHDPGTNLDRMATFVREAKRRGADVVVFPEDFLTGPVRTRLDLADSQGRYREEFRRLARAHRLDIVAGSVYEKARGKYYNTCYYVDAAGRVLGRYRKVNLWLTERAYATRGRETKAFDTKYGKVGLSICWDLAFPEVYRAYARQGADVVFNVSLWSAEDAGAGMALEPASEKKFVDACCVARAFENEVVLVYCNIAGSLTAGGQKCRSIGRSQIAMPFHGAVRKLSHNREEMFVDRVDTGILSVAEQSYRIREDLGAG